MIDDVDDLIDKLKDDTLRNDSFDILLKILNKFLRVRDAGVGKELWKLLDENITKCISENFGET